MEIGPDQSCADWILYEAAEIQIVGAIPVWHHGVVGVDRNGIDHHGLLVVIVKVVESVHRFAEVDRLIHHDGIVHPRCS